MLCFIGLGLGGNQSGEMLCCASCGEPLARVADLCRILGRPPRKSYVNPSGIVCPLVTLSRAERLEAAELSSTEHTWFSGYAWRPVACASCGLFLGWRFETTAGATPEVFYGLLEDRLVARTVN